MKTHNLPYKADFLKLRLRGKGSGFKEGPDQKGNFEFQPPLLIPSIKSQKNQSIYV